MDKEIQKAFNDTVGKVLTYLDEDQAVKLGTKAAVKAALYELCDKKIMPKLAGKGIGNGTQDDDRFNR